MSDIAAKLTPDWTEEDFYGDAVCAWLWEQKDKVNQYLFQRMLMDAQRKARNLKVPMFAKAWAAYSKGMAQNSPQVLGANMTQFADQPTQLICGKYRCVPDGISYQGRMGEMIDVCSHPLMPVKRLINVDTGEEKIQLAFNRGHDPNWKTLVVSKDTVASAQKIIALAKQGIAVNSENSREIVRYLNDMESANYDDLPVQHSTGHMGWLPNGEFSPYCPNIIYDGDSVEGTQRFKDFEPHGDREQWMRIARETRSGMSVPARMALAASFAAPLVSLVGGLPFFLHIWGTQGCGKTVGLMLAASVWGNPNPGGYIKSFGGTKNSHELTAAFYGNVPVFLDELQVISDRKSFDDIIYMLCEGFSKGRGAKEGGLQLQRRWSTDFISSGEMPIVQSNSGGGAAVRCIEVNYGGQPLFPDAREVASLLRENYGFAGREFVEALKTDQSLDDVRQQQKTYQNMLSGEIQDKQVLSASIILAADWFAEKTLFHDGMNLTAEDIRPFLVTTEQADANRRCWQWLMGIVAANPRRFDDGNTNNGELWGKKTEVYVYLIKPIFERLLQAEGYSASAFLTWAKRNGKLDCEDYGEGSGNRRNTKRMAIGGSMAVCVGIRMIEDEPKPENDTLRKMREVENEPLPF